MPEIADKIENKMSELRRLLVKNADPREGLSKAEKQIAEELINNPHYAKEKCWTCKTKTAIYDTGLCQSHAMYSLITGKLSNLYV